MKDSWMAVSCKRPSMENICNMIKVDLQELETEETIALRIKYVANISEHSSSRCYNFDQIP
jgi:vacuolar-type H+-ATPase subunit D/Vma8